MSDIIPCPSCHASLRLPPGADKVRCPRCKTILAIAGTSAPPDRPLLPFDRPNIPAHDDSSAAPPHRPARRGKVVYDHDPIEMPTRRPPDRERKVLEAADALARPARNGIRLLAWGAACSCAAAVLYFLAIFSTVFSYQLASVILALAAVCLGLHWLFTVGGFGFCCGGPHQVRGLAAAGVGVQLVHAAVFIPLIAILSGFIDVADVGFNKTGVRNGLNETLLLSNIFNNLSTITDLPVYLLCDGTVRPIVLMLPIFGAALEFAKLSLIGILTNHYAIDGKAPELGYLALRFVYRIFWLVIAGAMLKLGLWVVVKVFAGEPLLVLWFAIPVSLLTLGYFLWWAFAWFAQCQVMFDAVQVIDPRRFADTRERLEI